MTERATVRDVRSYWESHPLMTHELTHAPGTKAFFLAHERIKYDDVEKFAMHFWQFPNVRGTRVLDVGCGPGFLTRHFAKQGAHIIGMDLTWQGVRLTKTSLDLFDLAGQTVQGNAEQLPYPDASFDYVFSSGVLHHTPNTAGAIAEVYRVLKPGGQAIITLYYKNILLRPPVWALTKRILGLAFRRVPGRERMVKPQDVDDFTRMYDGDANPVGKAYTRADCARLFAQYTILDAEVHFFPKRFLALGRLMPTVVHHLLDRTIGTMIYYRLAKAASPAATHAGRLSAPQVDAI